MLCRKIISSSFVLLSRIVPAFILLFVMAPLSAAQSTQCPNGSPPIRGRAGITSITIFEMSRPNFGPANYISTLPINDSRLNINLNQSILANDLAIQPTTEFYDFFLSDANGTLNPNGGYVSIECSRIYSLTNAATGNNIDAVSLNFADGHKEYATVVSSTKLGTGLSGEFVTTQGFSERSLGEPDAKVTLMGDGSSRLTLGFCPPQPPPQCADGIDNDGDGRIDYPADPGCESKNDDDELDLPECGDGKDNDQDGKTDYPKDKGCSSSTDDDERDPPKSQCSDEVDNDGDGYIDYPADPGCNNKNDDDELDLPECGDGKDNDQDGKTDYPKDKGCASSTDDDERDPPKSQCSDEVDNDGDGSIDYPHDPGCTSRQDDSEIDANCSITPTVSCILDNCDGTATAFFGYSNSNSSEITIAAGNNDSSSVNILSPGAAVQGQPSTFTTGVKQAVFGVKFPINGRITWIIKAPGAPVNEVTAKRGVSKLCAPITPILECVEKRGAKAYSAHFGYENENEFELPLSIGSQNRFIPSPSDRGQPNQFFKGVVNSAFTVQFEGENLTWRLGEKSVTANKKSKACDPDSPAVCNHGGDCVQCSESNIKETLLLMEGAANLASENAMQALYRLESCANDAGIRAYIKQSSQEVDQVTAAVGKLISKIPVKIKNCPEGVCTLTDYSPTIEGYNGSMNKLRAISQKTLRTLKKALGVKLRATDKRLGNDADEIYDGAVATSASVPRFASECD